MSLKKILTYLGIALVAIALLWGGRGMMQKREAQKVVDQAAALKLANKPLEFLATDLIAASKQNLNENLNVSGSLRAFNSASVKAKVSGELREVLVREGQTVRAGQVVARMDDTEYKFRVKQAQDNVASAQGQLEIAQKTRDNNKALLDKNFISQTAYDTSVSQFNTVRANVDGAQAALEIAKKSATDTVLIAPISGTVAVRNAQPGEKISPDFKVIDIVDLSQIELEAAVAANDLSKVKIGMDAKVMLDGVVTPYSGKVVRINPQTQAGNRSVLTYVRINNPNAALRVGLFAQAQLLLASRANVLTVPQLAVRSDGEKNYVYVIEADKLKEVTIKAGLKSDEAGGMVEVLDGLSESSVVVRSNLGTLKVGSDVKVLKP